MTAPAGPAAEPGERYGRVTALALRVREGDEGALARLLAGERSTGDEEVATFAAPGRVVHVVRLPCAQDAPDPVAAWAARVLTGRDEEREFRALCGIPGSVSTADHLTRARLRRRAHHERPASPDEREQVHHRALLYPVRAGHGEELCRLLAAGIAPGTPRRLASALVSSTVHGRGDTVVRHWAATASPAEELSNIARVVPSSGLGAALNRLLEFDADLTTAGGFRAFFTNCAMTCVSRPRTRLPVSAVPARPAAGATAD